MLISNPLFKKYTRFILHHEGLTSNDPQDTASSCAPFPGAYHTNKGVTYCTFRSLAESLGILPVTYSRFLALSDQDISKFVYRYYESVQGSKLPDILGLAVTEAAWLSGPSRAAKHLQDALNSLGNNLAVDGIIGPLTLAAVSRANPAKLYKEFWKERSEFLAYLVSLPEYDQYRDNWFARMDDFLKTFPITSGATSAAAAILLSAGIFLVIKKAS